MASRFRCIPTHFLHKKESKVYNNKDYSRLTACREFLLYRIDLLLLGGGCGIPSLGSHLVIYVRLHLQSVGEGGVECRSHVRSRRFYSPVHIEVALALEIQ